jgi:hypothetical protein
LLTNLKNIARSFLLGLSLLLVSGIATTTSTINNNFQSLFEDNNNSFMVYAQQIMGGSSTGGLGGMELQQPQQPGQYSAGTIASIQTKVMYLHGCFLEHGKVL